MNCLNVTNKVIILSKIKQILNPLRGKVKTLYNQSSFRDTLTNCWESRIKNPGEEGYDEESSI